MRILPPGKSRARCVSQSLAFAVGLALSTSGCLIIPLPPTDTGETRVNVNDHTAEPFVPGTTTRTDVILALGEPDVVSCSERQLAYRRQFLIGGFILLIPGAPQGSDITKSLIWVFTFDASGRLEEIIRTNSAYAVPELLAPVIAKPSRLGLTAGGLAWQTFPDSRWLPDMNGYSAENYRLQISQRGNLVLTESNLLFKTCAQFGNTEPDLILPLNTIASVESVNQWLLPGPRLVVRTCRGEFHTFEIFEAKGGGPDKAATESTLEYIQRRKTQGILRLNSFTK